MTTKVCNKCGLEKPFEEFYKQSKLPDGYRHDCKTCANQYVTLWRLKNKEEWNRKGRDYRLRLRRDVLSHYGGACTCCGEDREPFLGIDHIDGGGNEHRKEIGQSKLYNWLKRNNYPEGFQVHCHDCNMAKAFYGQCPHVLERQKQADALKGLFQGLSQ